ncbi:unnamed protein product [Brassica oleracea]
MQYIRGVGQGKEESWTSVDILRHIPSDRNGRNPRPGVCRITADGGSLGGESGSIKGSGPRDPRSESLHQLHNAPWSNQRHIAEKRYYWCCLRHQIDLYCFRLYLLFFMFQDQTTLFVID